MHEFDAIAQFLLSQIEGLPQDEQIRLVAWAIATERYRTINEIQMKLSLARADIDGLLPEQYREECDYRFRFALIQVAEQSKREGVG